MDAVLILLWANSKLQVSFSVVTLDILFAILIVGIIIDHSRFLGTEEWEWNAIIAPNYVIF